MEVSPTSTEQLTTFEVFLAGATLPAIGYGVGGASWAKSGDAKAKRLEECIEVAIRSGYRVRKVSKSKEYIIQDFVGSRFCGGSQCCKVI